MAIHCFKIGQIDPFKSSHRVNLFERPQADGNYGVMPMETLTKTAVERAQEKVNATSPLISVESIKKLNGIIEKASDSEAAVILDNLDHAINQAKAIEGLADILNAEEIALAWEQLGERYADLQLTPDEIRQLEQLRNHQVDQKIHLMEAHQVKTLENLKTFALLFVRDSEGKPLSVLDMSIEDGKSYTLDFKDPKTGKVNTFAQSYLTLGMILEAVNLNHVTVKKSSGILTEAFLWNDGRTYDKAPETTGSKNYVEILQGYSFKKPNAAAEVSEPAEGAAPDSLDAIPEATEPEDEDIDLRITAHMKTVAPDIDGGSAAEAPAEEPEVELNKLMGKTVDMPDFLAKENSYDVIKQIKNSSKGRELYGAIRMMAAIHREVQGPIDNRNMWKELHNGILSAGGKNTISFNEIAKAVYGESAKKLEGLFVNPAIDSVTLQTKLGKLVLSEKELSYFKEFKKAAHVMLNTLASAKEGDDPTAAYEATREAIDYTGEKVAMARVSDHFFERDSYGPPISVGAFKAIAYALSPKDRPIIDEDSWMTPAARTKAAKGYKTYGETEVISHARAFDKLMNSETQEAYLAKLNNALTLGAAHLKNERAKLGTKQEKKEAFTVPTFIAADIKNTDFIPTEDQIMAVRHGMMIQAAAELSVYQKVEDALPAQSKELTEKETAEVLAAAGQKIHGVLSGYIAAHNSNLDELSSYSASVSGGAVIDLGRGFSLEFLVSGNTFAPVIRGSAGASYEVAFGKNKKWTLEAYAKASIGLSQPKGFLGPVVGGGLSYELGEYRTSSFAFGGNLSFESAGGFVGIDRNMDNVLKKKIEKFKEKHANEITTLTTDVNTAIDALDVAGIQKEQLKKAYANYLDGQIASDKAEDFTAWYHQVKFAGAGILGAVGLKEGGLAVGPYITIGFGFKAVTLYVPPLETPEAVSASLRAGLPIDVAEYKLPEPDWVAIDLTDEVLYTSEGERTAAETQAEANRTAAFDALAKGVAENAVLTPGDSFTNLEIKDLDGRVQLYVDSTCGIEAVQDGPQGLALNLDRNDNLLIRVFEFPASQSRNSLTVVGITNDARATLNDIMNRSGNVLGWTQTKNGAKSNSSLNVNPNSTTEAAIFTAEDLDAKIASGSKTLGDLSKEGTATRIREVKIADFETMQGIRAASLFKELSPEDKTLARTVAEKLIQELDYDALATSNRNDEIDAKIVELYQAENPNIVVTVDHIYYARQYAMEMGRPSHKKVPLEWNGKALDEVLGEISTMAKDYFENHQAEILDGSLNGEFPEGTEFFIHINENGEMKVLQGYYDVEVHGEMLAPIEWNANEPEKTLGKLGLNNTPDNKATVKAIAEKIANLDWQETPLNSGATFEEAVQTMPGALLLSKADELYGEAYGDSLREMVTAGNSAGNPALAQEFTEDLAELMENGTGMVRNTAVSLEWETRSGLYNKCFNLVLGRNPVLKFTPPTKSPVKSGSTRDRVDQGAVPQQGISFATVRIVPSLIPIRVNPNVTLPDQTGRPNEDVSGTLGGTVPGDGAASGGNHASVGRTKRNK